MKLVVAISSRALFQLDESHAIFESQGVAAYCAHQRENEHVVLEPGPAFNLVRKLLALNKGAPASPLVEVVLLSRNSADTGIRIFNSIEHYQLDIKRAAFCSGASTHRYVEAFGAQLFLSTNPDDVRESLAQGHAAATILPSHREDDNGQLRIAFDGDAVLFSDDSERIYKQLGLDAFARNGDVERATRCRAARSRTSSAPCMRSRLRMARMMHRSALHWSRPARRRRTNA